MDKQKEIENKEIDKMGNIIAEVAFVQAHEINGDENLADIIATAIYNAGYRLESETEKRVVKEFAEKLKAITVKVSNKAPFDYQMGAIDTENVIHNKIDEIAAEFGKEEK